VVVTIHQPEHLPWLGFFDKVRQADVFVVLDHVQYRRRYFQNRNRVRGSDGPVWLTVPVKVKGRYEQPINEVEIDNEGSPRWARQCWNSLVHCYTRAPYFEAHAAFFAGLYARPWARLAELNEAIIRYVLEALCIRMTIVRSSDLGATGRKGDLMLDICRRLGAAAYLSGISGRDYLDPATFREAGIELRFQEFHHPVYRQLHEPFVPCLSVVDLLFTHGPAAGPLLLDPATVRLQDVFS
jgi:hypothetical protein